MKSLEWQGTVPDALGRTRRGRLGAIAAIAILTLGATQVIAGSFAYVAEKLPAGVSVVDTATNQISTTIAFPSMSNPVAVALAPDRKQAYVVGNNGSVFIMDTATNALSPNPVTVGALPTSIAIAPDGRQAYVVCQYTSTVSVVDIASKSVSATIVLPTGTNLQNIALTPDGLRAYVTAQAAGAVFVIDTVADVVLGAPIGVGSSPFGIAISPDGKDVYVTHNDSTSFVSVIDAGTNTVTSNISVANPYLFAVTFSPDGAQAYVTGGGGVGYTYVIDTATRGIVDTIPQGGSSIAITADGSQIYLPSGMSMYVIDVATRMLRSTITGLNLPQAVSTRPLPPGIPVPNVVGTTQGAAASAVLAAHLTVGTVAQQASATIALGSVISQSPLAAVLVGRDARVDLVVSSGVVVPNVTGQSEAAATTAITNAGLTLGSVTSQASSTVTAGNVISESPAAGTMVSGGSKIDLVVSIAAVDSPHGSAGSGGGGALDSFTLISLLGALVLGTRLRGGRRQPYL